MDLTMAAQHHARQCLARFSGGISDPVLRAAVKRQTRYWVRALTGKRDIRHLSREEGLAIVQAALDAPPESVSRAVLAVKPSRRWRPTRRKLGAYKRSKAWMRRGGEL